MSESKNMILISVDYEKFVQDVSANVLAAIEKARVPEDPEELIKVADIAKDNNVHVKTLLRRMDERHMPKQKLGKYIAIPRKLKRELLKKSA